MKLSIKTKLIAGGIAVMLASGGAGILIRQYYVQNTPEKALLHSTIAGTSIQATKQDTSDNINSLSLSKESNRKLSETIYFDNKQKNVNTSKNTKALEDDVELPRSNAEQDTEKHKLTILDFIPRKVFEYKAQKSLDELEIIVPQIVEHRRTINELDEYGFLKAPTQEERSEYLQQAREMRQELHEMELRAAELHSFLKDRDYDSIMPNWMREKADELDKPIISGEGWPPPKPQ